MGVNLLAYLDLLYQEKFRVLILHSAPEKSSELSKYVMKLTEYTGGSALDLLTYFSNTPELSSAIDLFGLEQLKELLVERSRGKDLLVIDRLDFLMDSWRKEEHQALYRMIQLQWNSFLENTRATLIFCMQSSSELDGLQIRDAHGRNRVIALAELNAIY